MYEFKMGGLWFRWSAFDRVSRWLAGLSFAAVGLATIPTIWSIYQGLGQVVSSPAPLESWMGWWVAGWGTLSLVLWWALSQRQDEMFNRVQNWTLGVSSSTAMFALVIWSVLASTNLAPPVSIPAVIGVFTTAFVVFWMIAVKRWA